MDIRSFETMNRRNERIRFFRYSEWIRAFFYCLDLIKVSFI